jgi:hypothetical protein
MKRIIILLALLGACFASNPTIKSNTMTNYRMDSGYEYISMEVAAQPTSKNAMTWLASGIAGYSSIDFYGMKVSKGSVPTTISAQAIYQNGVTCSAVQILTSGTDLTDIRSPYYRFTLPAPAVTRNISFMFLIAD